jgi:cobalt/nickel transport system permease protein
VLLVQALFFADGGLTALGLNVLNMAFIGGLGGYAIFAGFRKVLPRNKGMVVLSAAAAAALSMVLAAAAFSVEYAIGGQGAAPLTTVFAAMIGTHMLIGIGEAVITGLTIAAILAVRPDLVYGARDLAPELIIVDSEPAGAGR